MKLSLPEDTIAAISTPPGEGGIGIVRLSGPKAIAIAYEIFESKTRRDIRKDRGRVFYGHVRDAHGPIDEVLVHVMRAPHSYTCEDVVEINCHGGAAPLRVTLELALERGARLAHPGEFTKRAFLNGRIDLAQAEAVLDRIRAQSKASLRAAAAAADGALSREIYGMRDVLIAAQARITAAVDFPEEDLPALVDDALRAQLEEVRGRMESLLATADTGRLYREGAAAAIAGRPNVGKSSLFNALLRESRAIVTEIPGTTRDAIQEVITIKGIPVRLTDTAGLRATADEVERIGVEVARNALKAADLIVFVLDASAERAGEEEALVQELAAFDTPMALVLNKIDLAPQTRAPEWKVSFAVTCRVSAKTGEGLPALEDALAEILLGPNAAPPDQGMITRLHQRDSLRRAAEALDRALANFNASPEFLSIDLAAALSALGEITGETTPDDVLDVIFSQFCIGK